MKKNCNEDEIARKQSKLANVTRVLGILSALWTMASFAFYIGLDAFKIYRDGWTVTNILVTVFLVAQILMFGVFLAVGKTKEDKKNYKHGKKTVKIVKKLSLKALSVATAATVIVDAGGKTGLVELFALIVAVLSLAFMLASIIFKLTVFLIKRKINAVIKEKKEASARKKAEKEALNAQKKESLPQPEDGQTQSVAPESRESKITDAISRVREGAKSAADKVKKKVANPKEDKKTD